MEQLLVLLLLKMILLLLLMVDILQQVQLMHLKPQLPILMQVILQQENLMLII